MSKPHTHHPEVQGNLRNFDLTVDEIKLMKSINNMTSMIDKIEQLEPNSDRVRMIRTNIRKLQKQLEELRDNTLIR